MVQIAVAFAATIAAYLSAMASRASARAAQGNAVGRLMADYASEDMGRALSLLCEYSKLQQGQEIGARPMAYIAPGAKGDFDTANEKYDAVMSAGRKLHLFIYQAKVLLDEKIISVALFRAVVVGSSGYQIWATIWMPFLRSGYRPAGQDGETKWAHALLRTYPVIER